jgi:hypothetical protein
LHLHHKDKPVSAVYCDNQAKHKYTLWAECRVSIKSPKNIFVHLTGAKIAQYAGKHLHKYIVKRPEYKEGRIEDAMRQVCCSSEVLNLW